ncbi:LOW QUALITY PROTEIN: hypothetical protein Smp_189120 [Schistosoma mansoni]|uniref:hypothetical protein n=1 Tax=Schistosoma mansoni TaxID=6183 RepID=UPI00022DC21B|nr:LOW QUALITY PROTEIN: hypothetical protein Smp_189120 [Schistosoma mansoni]|eukprot:XP_018651320.1 LOW QUALITY PROTEIN: hypothetical protein Smp_189120 [Schistosoma mansoni]
MHTVCVLFSMRVCQTEWETEVVWVSQTLEWRVGQKPATSGAGFEPARGNPIGFQSNALTTRPS